MLQATIIMQKLTELASKRFKNKTKKTQIHRNLKNAFTTLLF